MVMVMALPHPDHRARGGWISRLGRAARHRAADELLSRISSNNFSQPGLRSNASSLAKHSRTSSRRTGSSVPNSHRRWGWSSTADASDAHEARIARFSALSSNGSFRTSQGWRNPTAGLSKHSKACLGPIVGTAWF